MKEKGSKKNMIFDPTHNFVKCPKLVREAPCATQKVLKRLGPKGPWAQFWAQGRRHEAAALEISPENWFRHIFSENGFPTPRIPGVGPKPQK